MSAASNQSSGADPANYVDRLVRRIRSRFWTADYRDGVAEIRSLIDQRDDTEALVKCRARLKWLVSKGARLLCEEGAVGHPDRWIVFTDDATWDRPLGEGVTANAAIDQAMARDEQPVGLTVYHVKSFLPPNNGDVERRGQ